MEIQGLSGAQNVHSQHGALHRTTSSSLRSTVASLQQLISTDNEADRPLEPRGPQSDTNNNAGPKTAQFRLLGENGSEVAKQGSAYGCSVSEDTTLLGLHNVTNVAKENVFGSLLSSQDSHRAEWRFEESGEVTPMALPLFEGEAEAPRQRRLTALRQQREDCALKPTVGDAVGAPAANGSLGSRSQGTKAGQRSQELFVVFNTARADGSCPGGGEANGKEAECCGSMEAGGSSVALYEPADGLRGEHGFSLLTENAAVLGDHQTVENVVLTNKYGDRICGQICTDNSDGANQPDHGAAAQIVQVAEGREPAGPQDGSHPLSPSACTPAGDTFSGTITINNQSIIVTIENGVLTLAAPPEGYVNKEDDMVSLKEHLGMKDHEDIVLLNYDSGTKSIGKISTRTVASSSRPEEPRPALSVSDSELALVDDCSLSQLGTSLDSCSVGKQGAGVLCAVTEADLIALSPKAPSGVCDTEGLNSPSLIRSKKDGTVTFACPEPGCSATFDSRQKLKVHLLNHTEEPRPYQCKVEGCGWAFATSYKLKRHLQSHDKQRPHTCEFEGCGRRFTTVYNLKAHVKVHEQDDAFTCEVCNEKFRSATRLTNHQRVHFAPQRPHKCDFPGCEKTFITFSALFSHNRTHFRETGQFTCSYPGCDKTYDKACRLKIHMRSHTGERPFVCDAEGCGWSFTSMSKLLRHKRKHDDDRRFVCPEEGCGKSFTRAEHLKGHSITHLGTKPFQCHAEGCYAKFSARSSLYIHSKKHKQDGSALRTRCPMASCSKYFSSRSNLKSHMLKHHHLSPDALNQMETTPTLTPSSELLSSAPASVAGPGIAGAEQLSSLDLSSLFSTVPGGGALSTGIEVGIPVAGSGSGCSFTMDLSLVSSGILTIDPSSVGATLVTSTGTALAKSMDPLIMAAGTDLDHQHGLEGTLGVRPTQGTINLVDVQTVNPEALGTLTALTMQSAGAPGDLALHQPLGSSNGLGVESSACLAVASVPELLASPSKVAEAGAQGDAGYPLACVEVLGPQEGGKVLPSQFVFPSSSFSSQKDLELAVSPSSFLDSGGSARTDYRAIQLAKKKKQRASTATAGTSAPCHRKAKASKVGVATVPLAASGTRYSDGAVAAAGGLTLRDPVTGTQYVQIQLLQDDPASDGDLPFQLSSQHGSSDSQLTVDLPVNILQEPSVMTEEDNGSDNSQFTGSTINLQDLE